ncbi:primosomal protein N' [Propionimicrobium sp. PCR01-08-3]|uniref:primosomal protein N' n=1 Tax=Propionimicrobium sp. PCR01-08-3 TaxID=3052086 RepID=UPI00255CFD07|nr:primosomal protein N' [Propionimicrobium sp. PCR01-08-3]WIY83905.1 primosomal protein N' [Propionimicrobium sp. PCR01-08-3]
MIARVAVDIPLAHLDRLFDYSIPDALADDVAPGVRVRVRFAGKLRDGYVVELTEHSEVTGKLAALSKVVSATPVLTTEQITLIRAAADHYAGCFADVVRLAVPPRHAATENAEQREWPVPKTDEVPGAGMLGYPDAETFLQALENRQPVRAYWQVAPRFATDAAGRDDWTRGFIQAAVHTLRAGRGVIIVVPDHRDLVHVRDALGEVIGLGAIAELHSELGTAARYRNYLAILRGQAKVVVGTRPAVYAPVANLGLICLWDDGDDLHAEPHAPYPHARDVAALRAGSEQTALLFAGHGRSAEIQNWCRRGWLHAVEMPAGQLRRASAAVHAAADSDLAVERDPQGSRSRLPRLAFETIRRGLVTGPVLVQVPRAGYLPVLACQSCRTPVRCPACQGPVRLRHSATGRQLDCTWCGRIITDWRCPVCGSAELRAPVIGSGRTAEELGRAFPGVLVRESSGDRVIDEVGVQPALVISTPGAEPPAEQGYAAAVLLDATRLLERPDLRAGEEAVRRWMNAVALVRPAAEDGTVCIVGPSGVRAVQALVRLDAAQHAEMELADRVEAGYPPAVRFITVEGPAAAIDEFVQLLGPEPAADLLGPVELGGTLALGQTEPAWRLSLRVPLREGAELTAKVKAALAGRTARKMAGALRVRVDPVEL